MDHHPGPQLKICLGTRKILRKIGQGPAPRPPAPNATPNPNHSDQLDSHHATIMALSPPPEER